MRITTAEHQAIRQAISEVDPEANIYLFGSRANDNARGGDIDLLIISSARVAVVPRVLAYAAQLAQHYVRTTMER